MASGDSRRASKGKKISPSISSNDDEHQWLSLNEWAAANSEDNSIKPGRNLNNLTFHNARYPLAEDIVHEENTKKQTEEVFSDDMVMSESVSDESMYTEALQNIRDNIHDHFEAPAHRVPAPKQLLIRPTGSQTVKGEIFERVKSSTQAGSENQNISKDGFKKSSVIPNSGEREIHKKLGHKQTSFGLGPKKLKNKLTELEDKKQLNEDLISKFIEPEDSYSAEENLVSVISSQRSSRYERTNNPSRYQRLDSKKKNARSVSTATTKRDNVRKEINSFPARRHYEAEGRANEDPIAPNPGLPSNSRTSSKKDGLQLSRDTINKIRKIQKFPDLIDECSELLYVYLEQDKTGMRYSEKSLNTHLDELLNLSDNEHSEEIFDYTVKGPIDNEEHAEEDDIDSSNGVQEVVATPKDGKPEEQPNPEEINMSERVDQMGHALRKNELLLHNLYKHLMDKQEKPSRLGSFLNQISSQSLLPEIEDSNRNRQDYHDNITRSSGEGSFANRNSILSDHVQPEHTVYRHPNSNSTSDYVHSSQVFKRNLSAPGSSLDNIHSSNSVNRNSNSVSSSSDGIQSHYLQNISRSETKQLGRPNIVSIDQIQSFNRNLHKAPSTRKKDNNLSDKIGRFRIPSLAQNSTEPQQANAVNISADSRTIDCCDSNVSLGSDVEHKTILNILKRDKRSEKIYERNPCYRVDNNATYNFERSDKKSAFTSVPVPPNESFAPPFNNENSFEIRSQQVPRIYPDLMPQMNTVSGSGEASQKPDDFLHSASQESDTSRTHQYQQVPSNYVQQLERQVQQLSQLYQGSLTRDQLFSQQHSSPNMTSCLTVSPQLASYIPHYQQMLLSLNQCYQTMYLQQLEIQQLKQTLQQGFNQDYYGANNIYTRSANYSAHPYNLPSCVNPVRSSRMTNQSNVSADERDEIHKYRSLHTPSTLRWPGGLSPQVIERLMEIHEKVEEEHKSKKADVTSLIGAGVRCVGSVSSPNENQLNGETLNNQVIPRTRANNFLDNFRSYSRLNLLSPSTNVKRNETPPLRVNPSSGDETVISNQSDDTFDEAIEIDR